MGSRLAIDTDSGASVPLALIFSAFTSHCSHAFTSGHSKNTGKSVYGDARIRLTILPQLQRRQIANSLRYIR